MNNLYEFFTHLNWQTVSTMVGIVATVMGIPKLLSILKKRRIETFNNNLQNSAEFQSLKTRVDEYAQRTIKSEGDIQTLYVKLDQFIDSNKHFQNNIETTLNQHKDDLRQLQNMLDQWHRDHIEQIRMMNNKIDDKKKWF